MRINSLTLQKYYKPCSKNKYYDITYNVIYADTDAMGVLYHGRFFELAERGRNALTEAFSLKVSKIYKDYNYSFVVRSVLANYRHPVFFDNEVTIRTFVIKETCGEIYWCSQVIRSNIVCCLVVVATALIDKKTLLPVSLDKAESILSKIYTKGGV